MSIALLFFFRNTIVSMREFRERERRMRVQYGKNAVFSLTLAKLDEYFFSPDAWRRIDKPPANFPPAKEETQLDFASFLFTLREKDKPLPVKYKIIPPESITTSEEKRTLIYRVSAEVWDGTRWSGESSREIIVERAPIYHFLILSAFDLELFTTKKFVLADPIYSGGNIYIASNDTMYFASRILSAKEIYYGRKDRYTERGMIYISDTKGNYKEFNGHYDSVDELESFHPLDLEDTAKGDGNPVPVDTWREDVNWLKGSVERWGGAVRSKSTGVKPIPLPDSGFISKDGPIYQKAGIRVIVKELIDSQYVESHYERVCRKHTANSDSSGGCGYYDEKNPCCEWDTVLVVGHWERKKHIAVRLFGQTGERIAGSGLPFTFTKFIDPMWQKPVLALEIRLFDLQELNPSPNNIYFVTFENIVAQGDTILAVRIVDSEILSKPIYLATDYPLYIKGNFNRHADAFGRPVDPRKISNPELDRWKPAFIAARSLTLLSENYQDLYALDYNKRTATDTEYNFVAFTGSCKTFRSDTGIVYGGGFEGILRLVENWKNSRLFFWGSVSVLWEIDSPPGGFFYGSPYFEPPTYAMRKEPYLSFPNTLPSDWDSIIPETTISVRFRL